MSSGNSQTLKFPANRSLQPDFRIPSAHAQTHRERVIYKIANSVTERESAFRLAHDAYTSQGLMSCSESGMRFDLRHLLPSSTTFIAQTSTTVICTLSLFPDNGMGLLLERAFESEVAQVRETGAKVAEITSLATRRNYFRRTMMIDTFVNLVGLMFHYAQHEEFDKLLIAVHPKHGRFYQRMLGFEMIGCERNYSRVGQRPAVALVHDFARARENGYPYQEQIEQLQYDPWELVHRSLSPAERQYFIMENAIIDRLNAA